MIVHKRRSRDKSPYAARGRGGAYWGHVLGEGSAMGVEEIDREMSPSALKTPRWEGGRAVGWESEKGLRKASVDAYK